MTKDEKKARLVELYFLSGSFQYIGSPAGSPVSLQYPNREEPGASPLPELYHLAGEMMFDYLNQHGEVSFDRILALPRWLSPLAFELAAQLQIGAHSLLGFESMEERADGRIACSNLRGHFRAGERALMVAPHLLGGRHHTVAKVTASAVGLEVRDLLVVVDRQQGGAEHMAEQGVTVHSLLTMSEMLDIAWERELIRLHEARRVLSYIARNQLWRPAAV